MGLWDFVSSTWVQVDNSEGSLCPLTHLLILVLLDLPWVDFSSVHRTCLCVLSGFPSLRRTASSELPPRRQRSLMLPQLCPSLLCRAGTAQQYPCFCHWGHISTWNGHGTGSFRYIYGNLENCFWLTLSIAFWHSSVVLQDGYQLPLFRKELRISFSDTFLPLAAVKKS